MPRIQNSRKLKLYQPDRSPYYKAIDRIFSGQVDWDLIRSHYDDFMRIAIAIQSGTMTPSAVLARLNSYSPADQEKAIVYNEPVANAEALQM